MLISAETKNASKANLSIKGMEGKEIKTKKIIVFFIISKKGTTGDNWIISKMRAFCLLPLCCRVLLHFSDNVFPGSRLYPVFDDKRGLENALSGKF